MQHSYTLEELAKFLNRAPKEIQKLAEKDILIGRKTQGKWTFALPDVVLWMEKEMTQVESANAAQLENAVTSVSESREEIVLSSIVDVNLIDVNFSAKTKSSVINEIVKLGESSGKLWDSDAMAAALREREEMASTALENGVAILHPRRPQAGIIAEDFLCICIAASPIPFGGGFDNKTDVFFLLCCQTDAGYLRTLGKLARTIKNPGFLEALRTCASSEEVYDLIQKMDRILD